jgi:hypothetical protein
MVYLEKDDLFGVKLIVGAFRVCEAAEGITPLQGQTPLQGFFVLLNRHTFNNADIRTSRNNSI